MKAKMGLRWALAGMAAASSLAISPQAQAAVIAFSGTETNVNPVAAPGGVCAPALTVSISPTHVSASGTSNFGAFAPTMTHCIGHAPPATYTDGHFSFDFGAEGVLTGTYTGMLSATGTPGLFSNIQNFVATGGTGEFAGASGTFDGTGTVQVSNGLGHSMLDFEGRLNLPAVPEPATWALMLSGVALVGAGLRRRTPLVAA